MIRKSKTVLKCDNCDPTHKLVGMNTRSITRGKLAEYCKDFVGIQIYANAPQDYNEKLDQLICPFCNHTLIDTKMPVDDFHLIGKATEWNRQVLDSMMELLETDVVEYQIKLNQFKHQQEQYEKIKEQQRESNKPHCPTCNSTNIKKISAISKAGSVAIWGIFSRKVHKQWHCNNCGSEW